MKRILYYAALTLTIAAVGAAVAVGVSRSSDACQSDKEPFCYQPELVQGAEHIKDVSMPKLAVPSWMDVQASAARTVTYQIATKGTVGADLDEFKSQVAETLNSPRGWSRLNVRFERVENDGQFTIWLSEDSEVPSFAPGGCDAIVSCTVGDNVIINETRWLNGSDAWNAAGGSLRDYRHMVLNHETGHWLGHGHRSCSEKNGTAAVMQQQTIDMQGCQPNAWPLIDELYAPKLGIYS